MNYAHDINISVLTQYLANQSSPQDNRFAFAYFVRIRNLGTHTVQLRQRYWLITDGNGKNNEVRGAGVVGEEPVFAPDDEFSYTSGAIIETPFGTMQGHYEFETASGKSFIVPIPMFTLSKDHVVN